MIFSSENEGVIEALSQAEEGTQSEGRKGRKINKETRSQGGKTDDGIHVSILPLYHGKTCLVLQNEFLIP